MNDFLQRIWLDNPIVDYAWVVAAVLFVYILKKYISHYLAGLLFRLVTRIWKDVDRKSFTSLLVQPLGFFLIILTVIIALYRLRFPELLNVHVYEYTVLQIVHCVSTIVLIVSFIWLLLRTIDFIAGILEKKADLTPDQGDNQLIVFFRDFFKVAIGIIGVMMVLSYAFGLNVGSLITGLSIVGAAIALALRESLENLIASFIIFFDKPFTTGDLVKVHNVTGVVERIGLRSTRIRSEQKTWVTVPNKQMVDSVLDNLSLRTQRKGELNLEISTRTPAAKTAALTRGIRDILQRHHTSDAGAYVTDITGKAIQVHAEYFTLPVTIAEFNETRQTINLEVLALLEKEGIELNGQLLQTVIIQGNDQ